MNINKQTVVYGENSREQYFRLHYCHSDTAKPVIVIIHGGFWMQGYSLDNALIDSVAPYFVQHGFVACEVEYRRGNHKVDGGRGGWPRTNEDISNALIKLHSISVDNDTEAKMDFTRVIVLGHSAGGTLALWACGYSQALNRSYHDSSLFTPLPFTPKLCVAVAPIGDLAAGHRQGLSSDGKAVYNYMGCAPQPPINGTVNPQCAYSLASPSNLIPLPCNLLTVAGTSDYIVPLNLIESFHTQCVEVSSPSSIEIIKLKGSDHFQLVNTSSRYWNEIFQKILDTFNN